MDRMEPKAGDIVVIETSISLLAPEGSEWEVRAVFDGVLSPGRYLDLIGLDVTPRVDRVAVIRSA